MDWIRVDVNLPQHPKVRKLAVALSVHPAQAYGHVVQLWAWAAQFGPEGNLGKHDSLDIAVGSGWDGDPDHFVKSLVRVGFVEKSVDNPVDNPVEMVLHDWYEHQGKLIERSRAKVAKLREAFPPKSGGGDIRGGHKGGTGGGDTRGGQVSSYDSVITNETNVTNEQDISNAREPAKREPWDPPGKEAESKQKDSGQKHKTEGSGTAPPGPRRIQGFKTMAQAGAGAVALRPQEEVKDLLDALLGENAAWNFGHGIRFTDSQVKGLIQRGITIQQVRKYDSQWKNLVRTKKVENPIAYAYRLLDTEVSGGQHAANG